MILLIYFQVSHGLIFFPTSHHTYDLIWHAWHAPEMSFYVSLLAISLSVSRPLANAVTYFGSLADGLGTDNLGQDGSHPPTMH